MEQNPTSLRLSALVNGRLGSLSLPRDLTLGGSKNNKKVYKPNLNVVRKKDAVKESTSKPSPNNRRDRKPYERKPRGGKINNVKSGRFVQSSSVFSEGVSSEALSPAIRSDRYLSYRDHEAAAVIEAPTIVKSNWNVDRKVEEKVICDLLYADDEEDSSSNDDVSYVPVLLPYNENELGFKKRFDVKRGVKIEIKKEPGLEDNDISSSPKSNEDSSSGSVKMENGPLAVPIKTEPNQLNLFNGVKKYDDDDLSVSLIKMPDSLPGKGFLPDSDEPADFTLNQMVEGQIGKLLVRSSGRIDVIIGDTKYHMDPEDPPGFIEHVMAMPEDKTANREPSVVHLTSISDRFVLSPSWETLFLQGLKKKKV